MVKLHLFSGFENKQLGITSDMEVGHLYSDIGDIVELGAAGVRVGLKPRYMQKIEVTALLHFDLWGKPLEKAKRLFPIVTDIEFGKDMKVLGVE